MFSAYSFSKVLHSSMLKGPSYLVVLLSLRGFLKFTLLFDGLSLPYPLLIS